MKDCLKWQKWISDDLDGELAPSLKQRLEGHLRVCPACTAYAERLKRLHRHAQEINTEPISSRHMQELHRRITDRLGSVARRFSPSATGSRSRVMRRPPLWLGLGALAAIALLLVILFPWTDSGRSPELYAFSLEDTLQEILAEIGEDPELESTFNTLLGAVIREAAAPGTVGLDWDPLDSPLFWESLTAEELAYLESEIKKEIKS